MKSIDKDAKLLIRSYINNIEEYLKTKSKMHPNLIDGILNEINDFVYIRSNELAKDKIEYTDVLKAIEECGSPSDICEQYLEDDVFDGRYVLSNKIVNEKSKSSSEGKMKETSNTAHVDSSTSALRPPMNYLDQLQYYPKFGFYRTCLLFLYLALFLILISSTIQSYQENIPLRDIRFLCMNFNYVIFFTFFLLLLEVGLLGDWKNKNEIRGFSRTQDDRIVILISRLTILIVLLKASLLPLPEYFFISFPFLFVLLIWMERQQDSNFWITRISPAINNLARSVETGRSFVYIKQSFNNWLRSINALSKLEKIFFSFSSIYLIFSWFFPWFYGWYPFTIPLDIFLNSGSTFRLDGIITGLYINLAFPFILLTGGIIVSNVRSEKIDNKPSKLISSNIWIVRIVVLRTFLMVTTYHYFSALTGTTFLLIVFWLLFEFSVNREQNEILMKTVVNGLKYLGSEKKPFYSPKRVSPPLIRSETVISENPNVIATHPRTTAQVRQVTSGEQSSAEFNETIPIIDYQSPIVKIFMFLFSAMAKFMKKILSLSILAIYTLAKPTYAFGKALVMAFVLLFGSILEVILFIAAFLTQLGTDGSYLVPIFTFDLNLHPYNESMYTLGGFTIWSWYVLGVLAVQIFILVVIEWLQFARKRDDGVIVVFFRNISRILLMIVTLGSIYQGFWYYDTYALLRLFSIIILAIFMEITSLKIRIERKHWQVAATTSMSVIESTENDVHTTKE